MVAQGELWLLESPNEKHRPVLIVSRNDAIPALKNIVVAPVTSTVRPIPTCIPIGPDEGIDHESVVTFDNIAVVPIALLTVRLGDLGRTGREAICAALRALAGC